MVKRRKNNTKKKRTGKGFKENGAKARKINASTAIFVKPGAFEIIKP